MKRVIAALTCFLFFLLSLCLVCGCGDGPGESPSNVAMQFIVASENKDADTTYNLLSKEDKANISLEEMREEAMTGEDVPDLSYEIVDEVIEGDTATVTIEIKAESQEMTVDLELVKENGAWKIRAPW